MTTLQAGNKIIFLVAPPRSLSTAVLRMMGARGDLILINEPACSIYNQTRYPPSKQFYTEQAPGSYAEVKNKILSYAVDNQVFIKEMSFSFEAFIKAVPELMADPNIYFTFLLRDPHPCIISYYKKMQQDTIDFIIEDFDHLTGFPALYNSFRFVQDNAINKPCVIHAEQLYNNTKNTVRAFCNQLNISYDDKHLNWRNLGDTFDGLEVWKESKKPELTRHWHGEAIVSQNFHEPTHYELDKHGKPAFSEIANPVHRSKCVEVYRNSMILHNLISESVIPSASTSCNIPVIPRHEGPPDIGTVPLQGDPSCLGTT